MIPLHLLTDNGFKFSSDIKHTNVFNPSFNLKPINYVNSFDNFYFSCYEIILSTGMIFTARAIETFKGLIFKPQEIKNDLDFECISYYRNQDYLYTPFCQKELFNDEFIFEFEDVINSLNIDFFSNDTSFKEKTENLSLLESSKIPQVRIATDSLFYKFLAISIVRGKVKNLNSDFNSISYKFNKGKENHERMKKDLLSFFESNNLQYEIIEYNKYFYVNYVDLTMTRYVEKFLKEDYNSLTRLFNNEFQSLFLMYLYVITNNTFYISHKTYLFYKKLAYNNNLVLSVSKNPINSNHKFSLVSKLVSEDLELTKELPDVIFLEDGYLTRIDSIKAVTKKGDANYLPEYLLIC